MSRIEPTVQKSSAKNHSFLRVLLKTLKFIITIPFKISLRLLFILVALIALIQICRMGIVQIPYVSSLVFREPQPIRIVESGAMSEKLLLLRLQESIQSSSIQHPQTRLTESDVTALLNEHILSQSGPFISMQAAVTEKHIELFGTLRSNQRVKIKAWIIPSVVQTKPQALIQRAWIGDVAVPQWMLSQSVTNFFTTTGFNAMMPKIPLSDVILEDSAMRILL